jgi:hypothetical protein
MSTPRVHRGGRPRSQGREDNPLVTVACMCGSVNWPRWTNRRMRRPPAGPPWCARPSIG